MLALVVLAGVLLLVAPVAVVLFGGTGGRHGSLAIAPSAMPAAPVAPAQSAPAGTTSPSASPSAVRWPKRYDAVTLHGLSGAVNYGTFAFAVNDRGVVVGQSEAANGRPHAVRWERGRVVDLGVLVSGPDEASIARDINNRGDIVGGSDGPDGQRAVLWRDGQMIDLGTLGGRGSFAYAINDRGQIVGTSTTATGQMHGFLWQDGQMRDLGIQGETLPKDINNSGQVVGWSDFGQEGDYFGFLWQAGSLVRLPGASVEGQANAINNGSDVVGNVIVDDTSQGYLWRRGTVTSLPIAAQAINDRGQVLGARSVVPHSMQMHVYLWWRGEVRNLEPLGVPDEAAFNLADINGRGQFVAGTTLYTPVE
jgi:probable HAF family extracellular repeat protein